MKTVTELWQQSQNDAEGMRLGYTTQQHYFAELVRADERDELLDIVYSYADNLSWNDDFQADIRARGQA